MKKNIREFLKSDLNEADFYNLPKEDLINLKDYLESLKEIDRDFENQIQEPIASIKEKCDWFKDFGFYYTQTIKLLAKDNIDLIAVLNQYTDKYEELAQNIPKIYLISPKVRTIIQRQKDLDLIQEELHLIDEIGSSMYGKEVSHIASKHSISENFYITYTPRIGMDIWYDSGLLTSYHERYTKQYQKPLLKDKKKERILERIQIRKEENTN